MLTAIVLKGLYTVGGIVVGWFAKRWHLKPYIDAVERAAKGDDK